MGAFEEHAAELLRQPPAEFVATRNARAKELRGQDRELADEVGRLPKPAPGAWAVDLLAHERPDQLTELLDLGAALREAQQALSRDRMQELATQAHLLVDRVARLAAGLAEQAGSALSDAGLGQVTQTLRAALADATAADAVRAGLLVRPLEPPGFGPVDLADAVAGTPVPGPARSGKAVGAAKSTGKKSAKDAREREQRQKAQQALVAATARLERAEAEAADQEQQLRAAEQARTAAEEDVSRLRERLQHAEHGLAAESSRVRSAQRSHAEAVRRLGAAERAVRGAEEQLRG